MRALIVAMTLALASAGAGQTSQTPPSSTQQSTAPDANKKITVTGCVEAGPNNTYTLTASADAAAKDSPTGTTATTPGGSKVAKTITYMLNVAPITNLKSHVGHTVQATGVESAPQLTSGTTDRASGTASTQGTSGSSASRPGVETTAQTQVVVRQLTVESVKDVSSSCSLVK